MKWNKGILSFFSIVLMGLINSSCGSDSWTPNNSSCEVDAIETNTYISPLKDYSIEIPLNWRPYFVDGRIDSSSVLLNIDLESENIDSSNIQIVSITKFRSRNKDLKSLEMDEYELFTTKNPTIQIINRGTYEGLTRKSGYITYSTPINGSTYFQCHFLIVNETGPYNYILAILNSEHTDYRYNMDQLLAIAKSFEFTN